MAKLLAHARETYGERRRTEPHCDHPGYVSKLLAAFEQPLAPRHPSPEVQPGIGPLSERELEVLQLVAAGFKNQEIAAELFVVVGTVKAHLNSIYRKLGVQSRIQAVSRAKELNLLGGDI